MLMADSRYIPRTLDIAGLSRRKSLFLFGPRQTGKTALIHRALPSAKVYDLLDGDVFRALSHRPARLGEELKGATGWSLWTRFRSCPNCSMRYTGSLNNE